MSFNTLVLGIISVYKLQLSTNSRLSTIDLVAVKSISTWLITKIDVLPIIETALLRLKEIKTRPGDCMSSIVHGYEYEPHFAPVHTKDEIISTPKEFPAFKVHVHKLRTSNQR